MKAVLILISILLASGCNEKTIYNSLEAGWNKSDKGVRYFYECIDGNKFIVTGAGHGLVLAGPVGKCEATP